MIRPSKRLFNELRPINFTRRFTDHAEGSVLVEMGQTRVLCTASVANVVPPFLKGQGRGWLTAEYGMLPRATHERTPREASKGKQSGRTLEIQRLIGRALRASLDFTILGERTITLDCDVLQADGGTRTAAINGGWLALHDAIAELIKQRVLTVNPIKVGVAAVSVGIYQGSPVLDLDYVEDSKADTDMNIIMNDEMEFIEIQGTAEHTAFSRNMMESMLNLAELGIGQILNYQRNCLLDN